MVRENGQEDDEKSPPSSAPDQKDPPLSALFLLFLLRVLPFLAARFPPSLDPGLTGYTCVSGGCASATPNMTSSPRGSLEAYQFPIGHISTVAYGVGSSPVSLTESERTMTKGPVSLTESDRFRALGEFAAPLRAQSGGCGIPAATSRHASRPAQRGNLSTLRTTTARNAS